MRFFIVLWYGYIIKILSDKRAFFAHNNKGDKMKNKNNKQQKNEKSAVNNQWTNNNLKYYPDQRERKDGPGGENSETEQQ